MYNIKIMDRKAWDKILAENLVKNPKKADCLGANDTYNKDV